MSEDIAEGIYFIENVQTERYLFQDGEPIKGKRGDEGGWLASPSVLGTDANYYNRAHWKIIPKGDGKYFVENVETQRYLFQAGPKIKGNRGDEGGWLASSGFQAPSVLGADANYDNRAYWKIIPQGGDKYFFENVQTQRYLFQDGPKIKGKRGDEGGWLASSGFQAPSVLGADANYYNKAYWKLIKQSEGSLDTSQEIKQSEDGSLDTSQEIKQSEGSLDTSPNQGGDMSGCCIWC